MTIPPDMLTERLRAWRVSPPVDPAFRPQVWARLRRSAHPSWADYLRPHAIAWLFFAVTACGIAAYTGRTAAVMRARADRDTLVNTYLVELDPRVQAEMLMIQP
ncbi:MAG: hypothetical protein EBT98_11600 [Opitutaceae bacterium]|jgi:hypothetical protein|nr:hypothetical protein [Opitutaceae bacterium]NBR59426.1 hypothetical protein [Opitutaceae bacterium]